MAHSLHPDAASSRLHISGWRKCPWPVGQLVGNLAFLYLEHLTSRLMQMQYLAADAADAAR